MPEQDLVGVLRENHAAVVHLAERLHRAAHAPMRSSYLQALTNLLGGHLMAIEHIVFPALQARSWKGVTSAMLVPHFELKRALAELLVAEIGSPRFGELAAWLAQRLAAHHHDGAAGLLPALQAALDEQERQRLGEDAGRWLAHGGGAEPRPLEPGSDGPASSTIEEARLVLSSLRDPTPRP